MIISLNTGEPLNKWLGNSPATVVAVPPALLQNLCGKCSLKGLLETAFPHHIENIYFEDVDCLGYFKQPTDLARFQAMMVDLAVRPDSDIFGSRFFATKKMTRVKHAGKHLFTNATAISDASLTANASLAISERGYEIFVFLEGCGHKGVMYDYIEEEFIFRDETDASLFGHYLSSLPEVPQYDVGSYKRPKNKAELEAERQEELRKLAAEQKKREKEEAARLRERDGIYDYIDRCSRRASTNKKTGEREWVMDEVAINEVLKYLQHLEKFPGTIAGDWADDYNNSYTNDGHYHNRKYRF